MSHVYMWCAVLRQVDAGITWPGYQFGQSAPLLFGAGRRSTTALDKQPFQRNQNMSRSLDLVTGQKEEGQGRLGMSPELAAWWGDQGGARDMGADPLQGWLGREQQARAIYKR